MVANSTSPLAYTKEVNSLVLLGFEMEMVADLPYLTMADMVKVLLQRNDSSLNASFGHIVGYNTSVRSVLTQLDETFPRLPTDNAARTEMLVSVILIAVTGAAVALRFFSRKFITPKKLRAEDWWCLAALIAALITELGWWLENDAGMGTHVWKLTFWQYRNLEIYILAAQMVFFPTHCILKFAFLIFYKRLFGAKRGYRIAIYAIGAFVLLLTIIGILGCIFQCNTVDWWNHFSTKKCMNTGRFLLIRSALYSTSDFMLVILPIPGVYNLRISRREKFLVILLLGLGIFAFVASVFRLMTLFDWFGSADFYYLSEKHNVWAAVELDIGLMCLCAPALKVLVSHKTSFLSAIPSVIAKNWSKHGTYRPENANRSSFMNTWIRGKRESNALEKAKKKETVGGALDDNILKTGYTCTVRAVTTEIESGTVSDGQDDISVSQGQVFRRESDIEEKGGISPLSR